jgi:hypothetical protein
MPEGIPIGGHLEIADLRVRRQFGIDADRGQQAPVRLLGVAELDVVWPKPRTVFEDDKLRDRFGRASDLSLDSPDESNVY